MTDPISIYIVDDDRDVRQSLAFMLGTSGHRASAFAEGEAFLSALPDLEPGCVLIDVRMPGMDGLGVLGALQQACRDWPVLVMTGHGDTDIAVQALRSGAHDFLEKPFEEELLLECIGRAAPLIPRHA